MAIYASKEAVARLQKFFDFLGEYGGIIKTGNPTFWDLSVVVDNAGNTYKRVFIGVSKEQFGDTLFDPQFTLHLTMDRTRIMKAKIESYISQSIIGTIVIDENDIAHSTGVFGNSAEKDPYGMRERFSCFISNMAGGPYLEEPKSVERYTEILADM